MPPDITSELDRQLRELEADLNKVEVDHHLLFAGRLPKLPWETRSCFQEVVRAQLSTLSRGSEVVFK